MFVFNLANAILNIFLVALSVYNGGKLFRGYHLTAPVLTALGPYCLT